jgi:hypothetical protein
MQWDEENPSDRSQWLTQHPVMERLDPPYNYNVFRGDVDGFVQAIKDAIAHPIERYANLARLLYMRELITLVQLCARADANVFG